MFAECALLCCEMRPVRSLHSAVAEWNQLMETICEYLVNLLTCPSAMAELSFRFAADSPDIAGRCTCDMLRSVAPQIEANYKDWFMVPAETCARFFRC